MNRKELMSLLLYLNKWTRRNQDKIKHKVRAKHFLEDMSYVLHWLNDEKVNKKIQSWRNESMIKTIKKLYGIETSQNVSKEKQ